MSKRDTSGSQETRRYASNTTPWFLDELFVLVTGSKAGWYAGNNSRPTNLSLIDRIDQIESRLDHLERQANLPPNPHRLPTPTALPPRIPMQAYVKVSTQSSLIAPPDDGVAQWPAPRETLAIDLTHTTDKSSPVRIPKSSTPLSVPVSSARSPTLEKRILGGQTSTSKPQANAPTSGVNAPLGIPVTSTGKQNSINPTPVNQKTTSGISGTVPITKTSTSGFMTSTWSQKPGNPTSGSRGWGSRRQPGASTPTMISSTSNRTQNTGTSIQTQTTNTSVSLGLSTGRPSVRWPPTSSWQKPLFKGSLKRPYEPTDDSPTHAPRSTKKANPEAEPATGRPIGKTDDRSPWALSVRPVNKAKRVFVAGDRTKESAVSRKNLSHKSEAELEAAADAPMKESFKRTVPENWTPSECEIIHVPDIDDMDTDDDYDSQPSSKKGRKRFQTKSVTIKCGAPIHDPNALVCYETVTDYTHTAVCSKPILDPDAIVCCETDTDDTHTIECSEPIDNPAGVIPHITSFSPDSTPSPRPIIKIHKCRYDMTYYGEESRPKDKPAEKKPLPTKATPTDRVTRSQTKRKRTEPEREMEERITKRVKSSQVAEAHAAKKVRGASEDEE